MRWVLFLFYTYNIEDFPSFELIRNPTRVKFLMPETGTALTWSTAFILISLFLFFKICFVSVQCLPSKKERRWVFRRGSRGVLWLFALWRCQQGTDWRSQTQLRKRTQSTESSYRAPFFFVLKANALRETGVLTGNSTCTTLGDPSKGIYIYIYIHVFFILHRVLPSLSLSLISYDIYVLKLNVKILF